jgi:alkylation response protein AidB-like acyl-CoA dehydrogenase
MGLVHSPEQKAFRQSLRTFFAKNSTEREVRRVMATAEGVDSEVWSKLNTELGVAGLNIPETYGGSGYTFEEIGIALEEAGRSLFCGPLLSSVVSSSTLLLTDDEEAKRELLPEIAAGTTIATLALTNFPSKWDAQGATVSAVRSDPSWTLSGVAPYVLDGASAAVLLVPAWSDAGVSLFAVNGDSGGVRRTTLPTLDQTRKLARVEFNYSPARLIGVEGAAGPLLVDALRVAAVALANEQAGVAAAAMEMAVQYAKDRVQFGRPIGSFQAIKHKCADLYVAVEGARSAAYMGAEAVAQKSPDLAEVAALAASYCSEACLLTGHENIQIHGGIGFTWVHPAHLYYKRAKSSEFLFGDAKFHREHLAVEIGL